MISSALLVAAAFKVFSVDGFSPNVFLPDADPAGGVETNRLGLAAARGEVASASFVIRPEADLAQVDFVPSDLKGPGGALVSASAVDVAVVKVWFRSNIRWTSSWFGNSADPKPINSLVLHDDSLVRVDFAAKKNYLRVDYSDGTCYVDVSRRDRNPHFNTDLQPVRDAAHFVPLDLKRDFRQQFWVTFRVPADAAPGTYRGEIAAVAGGRTVQRLPVELEILPFALPRPKTHYDTSRPYFSFWMGVPTLGDLLKEGHDLVRAERKLRAIYRSMKEHNAVNLSGVGELRRDSTDDLALRTLLIARQEGLSARPLINGAAFGDGGFVWNPGAELRDPEKEPEAYAKSLSDFRARVAAQNRIMDKYLGHHECYRSSVDECGLFTNRRSFGYWSVIHELGGRVWTDYADPHRLGFLVDMNDTPASLCHRTANDWQAQGARCVTYAGPFTGPECPDIWRRTKGLRYWYADYDGQHEYSFFNGADNRWNDLAVRSDNYCQFGIVHLTEDGLVSTLAWEGVREGLNDVRYFTLLRRRAEAAMASGDPAVARLGREAIHWQDGIDPEYVLDLSDFRRRTADWILRLMEKVGPEPDEPDGELAPIDLPPCAELPADDWTGRIRQLERETSDAGAPGEKLLKATLELQGLYLALLRRTEAVATLDRALADARMSGAQRGRLLLAKTGALLSPVAYEECVPVAELDAIAALLERKNVRQAGDPAARQAVAGRLAQSYLDAGEWTKAAAFADASPEKLGLDGVLAGDQLLHAAAAWKAQGDWRNAARSCRAARRHGGADSKFLRRLCPVEAEAAERTGDLALALKCYGELVSVYSPKDEARLRKWAQDQMVRVSQELKATARPMAPAEDDGGGISLDE